MATIIHNTNETSTIDVLWSILSQQTENVRRALVDRLNDSLTLEKPKRFSNMDEALAFIKTLSVKSGEPVPTDENGIETMINEKYS